MPTIPSPCGVITWPRITDTRLFWAHTMNKPPVKRIFKPPNEHFPIISENSNEIRGKYSHTHKKKKKDDKSFISIIDGKQLGITKEFRLRKLIKSCFFPSLVQTKGDSKKEPYDFFFVHLQIK